MEASTLTHAVASRAARPPIAPAQAAGRREARGDDPRRSRARLRGALRPLPLAPAGLLPPHAALDRGRRGRASGGLRQGARGDARRRAPDQRPPVAVPDRAQPLPQPPAPPGPRGPGLDGHHGRRGRRDDRRPGAEARGLPLLWSPTSRTCPRPSAPRCCCARSTPSPTRRSRRPWSPPCRRSSRCWSVRGCRSPRRPSRASSPAVRSGSSSPRRPRDCARRPAPCAITSSAASAAATTAASCARTPRRSPRSPRSARWRCCTSS